MAAFVAMALNLGSLAPQLTLKQCLIAGWSSRKKIISQNISPDVALDL
jgi:hypothetical protein